MSVWCLLNPNRQLLPMHSVSSVWTRKQLSSRSTNTDTKAVHAYYRKLTIGKRASRSSKNTGILHLHAVDIPKVCCSVWLLDLVSFVSSYSRHDSLAPLIRLRRMALYKFVLIAWLIDENSRCCLNRATNCIALFPGTRLDSLHLQHFGSHKKEPKSLRQDTLHRRIYT